MNDLCAVVPYRADAGGIRRRNASVVLRWLADGGVRTVLAEHSDEPDHDLVLPATASRLHLPAHSGAFSKALACNWGVTVADTPVVALVDADTFTSMPGFLACADAVRQDFDVVRPFGRLVPLDEADTLRLADGDPFPTTPSPERDDDRSGELIPLCGGAVIIRTDTYVRVGGMDETFEGWGGEDDALSIALERSNVRRAVLENQAAFHLDHPRALPDRYLHPHYVANVDRAKWWHEAPEADLARAMSDGADRLRRRRTDVNASRELRAGG